VKDFLKSEETNKTLADPETILDTNTKPAPQASKPP
jgi:hypothetical protein